MFDFRPFAGAYVSNTYEEFSKKAEEASFSGRKGINEAEPLFTYSPSEQDVREQLQRFQDLQQLVIRQRMQIREKDRELARCKEARRETGFQKLKESKEKRRTFLVQLRAFSSGRGVRESQQGSKPTTVEKTRKSPRSLQGAKQGMTLPRLKGKVQPHRDLSVDAKATPSFYITEAFN